MRAGFLTLPVYVAILSALPTVARAADDVGFPQLKQIDTFASQVFWLAICFALLYLLMSRLALPGVATVLEERRATLQKDLDDAARFSDEAAQVRKVYEESLARARTTAQGQIHSATEAIAARIAEEEARFTDAAQKRVIEATARIDSARKAAQASIPDIAADLAAEMSAAVAGVQVQKADAKAAVAAVDKKAKG